MVLAIEQLITWKIAPSPINYTVSYEYICKKNSALNSSIKSHLDQGKSLDNFFLEELYKSHILGQSKFRENIVEELDIVLNSMQKNCRQSFSSATNLINQIDDNTTNIESNNQQVVLTAIKQLRIASVSFKSTQQALLKQLEQSQQHSEDLREELKEVRKEIDLDPVTGLYKSKAISKYVEEWHSQDPNKNVAVIIININQLSDFSQRFGALLGDVILSKIANKISSYVNNSGIPVRTGGDEFLILLPEVEKGIATEIAEKISFGVEKLRFVSVQTGVRLPKISVSLGVSVGHLKDPIETCITRARQAIETSS